MLHLRTFKG